MLIHKKLLPLSLFAAFTVANPATAAPTASGEDIWARKDHYVVPKQGIFQLQRPGVLSNDIGGGALGLKALLHANVSHGKLEFNNDGSFSYTPEANYTGLDTFTYQAKRGDFISEIVTVTLEVVAATEAAPTTGTAPQSRAKLDLSICGLDGDIPINPDDEVGVNIINKTAANQVVTLSHTEGNTHATRYLIEIYNRGAQADEFFFKAVASSPNWKFRVFDAARGGNEITDEVLSKSGWKTPALTPHNATQIRLEVSDAAPGAQTNAGHVLVTAISARDENAIDAVKAGFGFQRIAKLQYSLDQSVSWHDAPSAASGKVISATAESMLGLRVVPADPTLPWPFEPELKPLWSYGKSEFFGDSIWIDTEAPAAQPKSIQVECGNVLVSNIKVEETYEIELSSDLTYIPLGGGEKGVATLTAKVTKSDGKPYAGGMVRFSALFEDGAVAGTMTGQGPNKNLATTDAKGIATVKIVTANRGGDVAILAMLLDGEKELGRSGNDEIVFGLIETETAEPVDDI